MTREQREQAFKNGDVYGALRHGVPFVRRDFDIDPNVITLDGDFTLEDLEWFASIMRMWSST